MNKPSCICHPFQRSQGCEISCQLPSTNLIGFVLLMLVLSNNGKYFSFFHCAQGASLMMPNASNAPDETEFFYLAVCLILS